jgi:hypothetical protein
VTGTLLAGIGHLTDKQKPNFMVVDKNSKILSYYNYLNIARLSLFFFYFLP